MTKLPGQRVRGSTTGRPIMVLLDVLGKRWTLRLLWELHQHGPGTFRDLRARCEDISPTWLNTRLKELRELSLVELGEAGFVLTHHGYALSALLNPLDDWAKNWARDIANKFNHDLGVEFFPQPEPVIQEAGARVPAREVEADALDSGVDLFRNALAGAAVAQKRGETHRRAVVLSIEESVAAPHVGRDGDER